MCYQSFTLAHCVIRAGSAQTGGGVGVPENESIVRVWYDDLCTTEESFKAFPFDNAATIEKPVADCLRALFPHAPRELCERLAHHRPLTYVFWDKALWVKFHDRSKNFVRSFTNLYPSRALEALVRLDRESLRSFFPREAHFVCDAYLDALIERRDELLVHACQTH